MCENCDFVFWIKIHRHKKIKEKHQLWNMKGNEIGKEKIGENVHLLNKFWKFKYLTAVTTTEKWVSKVYICNVAHVLLNDFWCAFKTNGLRFFLHSLTRWNEKLWHLFSHFGQIFLHCFIQWLNRWRLSLPLSLRLSSSCLRLRFAFAFAIFLGCRAVTIQKF